VNPLEQLSAETFDAGSTTEVIRPAARLGEVAARTVLTKLAMRDARHGGEWIASPSLWERYDRPWPRPDHPGDAMLVGSIQVAYGTPTTYEITIYRATVTQTGVDSGWTVRTLCNEALGYADLSLDNCPRVDMAPPPVRFQFKSQ